VKAGCSLHRNSRGRRRAVDQKVSKFLYPFQEIPMFARSNVSRSFSTASVLLIAITLLAQSARADVSQKAIDQASTYLDKRDVGKDVLSFVHFGADYKGHAFLNRCTVVDENGKAMPDKFALVYRFNWENDGVTDVAFFCDNRGAIYYVKVIKTNARLQQPFAMANMTIQVLGDAMIKAMGDNLKEQDRVELKRLIDTSDSHGMLMAYLRLGQILQ
jgi:hypothetical protein